MSKWIPRLHLRCAAPGGAAAASRASADVRPAAEPAGTTGSEIATGD